MVGTLEMEYIENLTVFERIYVYNRIADIKTEQHREEERSMKDLKEKSIAMNKPAKRK